MKNYRNPKHAKGFTFIELSIVLAVIFVLGLGAMAFGPRFFGEGKYSDVVNVHTTIVNDMLSQYGKMPFYDATTPANSLVTKTVVDLGAVDKDYVRTVSGNTVLSTGFDGSYLTISNGGATNPNTMVLTYTDLPVASCGKLLPRLHSRASLVTITPAGGSAVTVKASASANVSNGAVAAACSGVNTVDMTFNYNN